MSSIDNKRLDSSRRFVSSVVLGAPLVLAVFLSGCLSQKPNQETQFQGPQSLSNAAIYDDFSDVRYQGSFDPIRWVAQRPEDIASIGQQDGILVVAQGKTEYVDTFLLPTKYSSSRLLQTTIFQADVMLDASKHGSGNVSFHLSFLTPGGDEWYSECSFAADAADSSMGVISAWDAWRNSQGQTETWGQEGIRVQVGTWHTLRIVYDPATVTVSYFLDGHFAGSHIPSHSDRLAGALLSAYFGVASPDHEPVTGYFDNVRIGAGK